MKVGSHHNQSSEQDYVHATIARHLPKPSLVKLIRDPISVGIEPESSLSSVFCGVGNTIEVASNVDSNISER